MATGKRLASRLLAPSSKRLLLIAVGLATADLVSQRSGAALLSGGVSDEIAHACTGILVLWALVRQASERMLVGVLLASVAIDLDHAPDYLGFHGFSAGTPRPYTHSLLSVAMLVAAALIARRHAILVRGLILGITVHFWRDLSESGGGVSLLWPFSKQAFRLPHASYLGIMAAVVAVDAGRCWRARDRSREPDPPGGPGGPGPPARGPTSISMPNTAEAAD